MITLPLSHVHQLRTKFPQKLRVVAQEIQEQNLQLLSSRSEHCGLPQGNCYWVNNVS
jgi:hypothetical protein